MTVINIPLNYVVKLFSIQINVLNPKFQQIDSKNYALIKKLHECIFPEVHFS